VLEEHSDDNRCRVRFNVKHRLVVGDEYEVITPGMKDFLTTIVSLQKEGGEMVREVHPGTVALAYCRGILAPHYILRQAIDG